MAALLICAAFGFTAFADNSERSMGQAIAAVTLPDTVMRSNAQSQPVSKATAYEQTDRAMVSNKTWVLTHIGVPPLDIFRAAATEVKCLAGYGSVAIKPKIGFTGVNTDHYARADV